MARYNANVPTEERDDQAITACIKKNYTDHMPGRTICFVYLDEKLETNAAATTLGARGFSCAVSGVGHVCIMNRFAARAGLLRPPKPSEVFPSAAHEKISLVSRVGGDLVATDILSACINV